MSKQRPPGEDGLEEADHQGGTAPDGPRPVLQAILVDGELKLLGPDGKPNNEKLHGRFDFSRRGDVYFLTPKEEAPPPVEGEK